MNSGGKYNGQTLEVTIFLPYPDTPFGEINCELFAKTQPFLG